MYVHGSYNTENVRNAGDKAELLMQQGVLKISGNLDNAQGATFKTTCSPGDENRFTLRFSDMS